MTDNRTHLVTMKIPAQIMIAIEGRDLYALSDVEIPVSFEIRSLPEVTNEPD